jgi:hypothetical protein
MNMPGFTAETSLSPATGQYQGNTGFGSLTFHRIFGHQAVAFRPPT